MTNKNYDFALICQVAEDFYDFFCTLLVNGIGWLIGENYLRIIYEGSGYEKAVIFAAGESGRIVLSEVGDAL